MGMNGRFGTILMSAIVSAVSPTVVYSCAPVRPAKDWSCAEPMTTARPLTKPIMHG